jgi:hypothetical protein
MKTHWQFIVLAVLLILMAVVLIVSYQYSYIQAKLAPMSISGLIIILTATQLYREHRANRKAQTGTDQQTVPMDNSESFRPFLIQGFWMIGFVLAIALFGILVAIPLFIISYMRTKGILWRKSISISALTLIIVYTLFTKILDVSLYAGWISGLLKG